jgi:hypothetical protein
LSTSTATSTPNVSFVGATGPGLRTGDAAFDAQIERSLTAAMRGSADLGEVAVTVSRITPGDLGSWRREWRATGDRVRAEGDESLAAGHRVSARRCFLRVAEYHRQAFFFSRDDLTRQDLQDDYAAHVSAFRAAVPLLDHRVETMEVERDGVVANGYLLRPADFRCRMATHGVTTLTDYFRSLTTFTLEGLADRITCPLLVTDPEGDFASLGQIDPLVAAVSGPVTRHRFTAVEGAAGHCEGLGQFRLERVVHDWIADTLRRTA